MAIGIDGVSVEGKVGVAAGEGVMTKKVGELPAKTGLLTAVFRGRRMEAEVDAAAVEAGAGTMDKGFTEIRLITPRRTATTANAALRAKERRARLTYSRRKRKFARRRLACKARIPKK